MKFLTSSIGKKIQMALTGLLLCGFLVAHLAGNLFLYKGPEAFNHYANALAANPLLPLAELGLVVLFALHIVMAIWTRIENWRARPDNYAIYQSSGGRTWGSATMMYSAILLFVFLIIHLKTFRFQPDRSDLYKMAVAAFHDKLYSLFYAVAMGALALHLSHGFQGGFQTLGVNHPKYTPWIKRFGLGFALVVALGFASIPLWVAFCPAGPR